MYKAKEKPTVSVVGCGNVGTQFAVLAAQAGWNLYLYDVVDGLSAGRSLDIMQAQYPLGFESRVKPVESLDEALDADVWVITAGKPRKPGMSRADLIKENSAIIGKVAEAAKKAVNTVFIIVTNPLDVMVTYFAKKTGIDRFRILGMGGILDSARMSFFISEKTQVPSKDIEAWVLGAHSDSMVPCFSLTRIQGRPADEVLSVKDMEWVKEKTINGGAEIVSYLKTGSAFIAPAASIFLLAKSVLEDTKKLLPVSVYANGEYGFKDAAIGLPCVIGRDGILSVEEVDLKENELRSLKQSFEEVKKLVQEI